MCYISRKQKYTKGEKAMITLEEILKKDEEEIKMPAAVKERLWVSILKQIIEWLNQKNITDE